MALTPDQRAIVQLLLKPESYPEIASLIDVSESDARARARQALGELAGSDPDLHVGLTDYLLGQADPIGRADAVRHLQACEQCNELVQGLLPQLQLLAPEAELPQPPPLRGRGGRAAPAARDSAERERRPPRPPRARRPRPDLRSLPPRQAQMLAGLVAAMVAVVIVVLVVSGGGGGDAGSRASSPTTSTQGSSPDSFVRVNLRPLGGSGGAGVAVFSIQRSRPVLEVQARGLTPSPQGSVYVVWLYNSNSNSFPLASKTVGPDGRLSLNTPVASQVAALLSGVRSVDISLEKASSSLPRHRGTSVLRGPIPGGAAAQGAAGTATSAAP